MRVVHGWVVSGAIALSVLSGSAMAQCAGFTDVVDDGVGAGAVCPAVQWIKNRNVTVGCSSTTLYCPTNNVTRAQMALFMNRLGAALTPMDLGVVANDSVDVPVDLSVPANRIRCAMNSDIPLATYPRRVNFNNKVNLYNPTARVDILAEVVFSTDGGASWIAVPDSKTYQTLNPGQVPADNVTTYQLGFYDLQVGTNYRFALRVMRNPDVANPGTGNVAIYCINRPSVMSRNSASAPFDLDDNSPPREGRAALPPGQ